MKILLILSRKSLVVLFILIAFMQNSYSQASQAITEIVTDFGGYFRSGVSQVNTTKPNNSHNLLAFTYNNVRYATGVNNALLTTNGLSFQNTIFRCLPMNALASAPTGNTKVGLGALYDAVANGPSNPPPANNIPFYLTDGNYGLNLGTGIANLPAGTLDFDIDIVNATAIGDGVPDIIITQIADPSSGTDQYSFLNSSNQLVGNAGSISFTGISAVANWTADFYEASVNPMTLGTSFTNTDRPLRMWAADFSFFGITQANYNTISRFRIQLNGNSDIAFIAYNYTSSTIVPVKLSDFAVAIHQHDVQLKWETQSEINASHFEIQRSTDAASFYTIARRNAEGNSVSVTRYDAWDNSLAPGTYFYRLKMIDLDGTFTYSSIRKAVIVNKHTPFSIFPNPVISDLIFMHPPASAQHTIQLLAADGKILQTIRPVIYSTQTEINTALLAPGTYVLVYHGTTGTKKSHRFVKS